MQLNWLTFYKSTLLKKERLNSERHAYLSGCGKDDMLTCMFVKNTEGEPIHRLSFTHEEAITRIILHTENAIDNGYSNIVLYKPHTDVFMLYISKG